MVYFDYFLYLCISSTSYIFLSIKISHKSANICGLSICLFVKWYIIFYFFFYYPEIFVVFWSLIRDNLAVVRKHRFKDLREWIEIVIVTSPEMVRQEALKA